MLKYLNTLALSVLGLLFQVSIVPAYLAEPFRPNILIIFVTYLGFRVAMPLGAVAAFTLGLIQDTFSGLYFGLGGFSYLVIYLIFNETAARVYTESRALLVIGVFLASLCDAGVQVLLLLLFSEAPGAYQSIFESVLPRSAMTTVFTALVFLVIFRGRKERTI
jgi:rod shape-determining protein MreD